MLAFALPFLFFKKIMSSPREDRFFFNLLLQATPVFVIKAPILALSWQLTTNQSVGRVITCGQLETVSVRVHVCVHAHTP